MWSRDLIRYSATPRALLVSRPHPRSIISVVYPVLRYGCSSFDDDNNFKVYMTLYFNAVIYEYNPTLNLPLFHRMTCKQFIAV